MKKLSLLFLTFFSIQLAFANNHPGAITLTFSDAYYHFAGKRHFNNESLPNAAIAYNFDEHWAAEGFLGLVNTNIHPPAVTVKKGVHGYLGMVDALYRFRPYGRFEPYVEAGVGILSLKPNGSSPDNQGNINAGIGTQFFMTDWFAFRAEARDVYTLSGGKNDYLLNLGISFVWDRANVPSSA